MPEREPAAWLWLKERLARLRQAGAVEDTAAPEMTAQPRVAVVTDSAAALPGAWSAAFVADHRLIVVPMPVLIGDDIYGEADAEVGDALALALASGVSVKTSRPSPGRLESAYRSLAERGYESIVSIHLSSALSGTVDAAKLAAERVEIPVLVLDTLSVGMAQGMAVQSAVIAAAAQEDAESVLAFAQARLESTSILFYVPSLEQLRRGGRIGAAASWLGTMLAIKPILKVENGRVVPLERVRSAAKAVARLEELVAQAAAVHPEQDLRFAVHHFGNQSEAEELAQRLALRFPQAPKAQISALPAVLAAHAGLGVIATVIGESSIPH
ncbi:DegV family protein [Pseudarthrobacter sp. J1738]|uniref:DegV family protein n=1 Tax=unclassified Pseudarthrobacter TaxID=2647000 RepID=UPI003D265D77